MISFVLPTNKLILFSHILRRDSLVHLAELQDFCQVEFLIVGQGLFNSAAARKAEAILREFYIDARFRFVKESSPCYIAKLRQAGADLNPDANYYMFVDDNMEFKAGTKKYPESSGARYAECLQYFDRNPSCGIINCVGSLGGSVAGYAIEPYRAGKLVATAHGLIFRNAFNGMLFPREVLKMPGGFEEMAAALFFNDRGFYIAKQFNNPTHHKDLKKHGHGNHTDNQLHDLTVADKNILGWIRKNYHPKYSYGDRILNKGHR